MSTLTAIHYNNTSNSRTTKETKNERETTSAKLSLFTDKPDNNFLIMDGIPTQGGFHPGVRTWIDRIEKPTEKPVQLETIRIYESAKVRNLLTNIASMKNPADIAKAIKDANLDPAEIAYVTRKAINGQKDVKIQAQLLAQLIHTASAGMGTNEEMFEAAISGLTKNNYARINEELKKIGNLCNTPRRADADFIKGYIESEFSFDKEKELLDTIKPLQITTTFTKTGPAGLFCQGEQGIKKVYDAHGNLLKIIKVWDSGPGLKQMYHECFLSEFEYEYDEKGNILKKHTIKDDYKPTY